MKCPLFAIAWAITRPGEKGWKEECLEEECAWWDDDYSRCSMRSVIEHLDAIEARLTEIEK